MFPWTRKNKSDFYSEIISCHSFDEIKRTCNRMLKKVQLEQNYPWPPEITIDKLITELGLTGYDQCDGGEQSRVLSARIYLRLVKLHYESQKR